MAKLGIGQEKSRNAVSPRKSWGGVVFDAADVRSCKAHTSWYHGVKVDITVLKKVIVPS